MPSVLPAPSFLISTVRYAHVETERGVRFAAFLDRLTAREAERDAETGLTPAEEADERAYRVRVGSADHEVVGAL